MLNAIDGNVVDLDDLTGVETSSAPEQKTFDGKRFPLILTPSTFAAAASAGCDRDIERWLTWTTENRGRLRRLLLQHGAILFRGFPVDTPEDFDAFVRSFGYETFPYVGGAAARTLVVADRVATANEAPSEAVIPFHHEMAQCPDWPAVLFFYCDVRPGAGGETPLALSPVALRLIADRQPEFVRRLAAEGVRYARVAPDGDDTNSAIGRGWQSTFQTTERGVAEERAREQNTEFEWLEDGSMRTVTKVIYKLWVYEK